MLDLHGAQLLRGGRCEVELDGARVTLVGAFPVALGREADVVVRGASVSRRHALVRHDAPAGAFTLEDAGSRSGTTLDGVPIAAALPLAPGALVGFGADLAMRVQPSPDAGSLGLEVERGMDRGRRVLLVSRACSLPCGSLRFEADGPVITPTASVALNGQKVALAFTLVRGDRVEVPGHLLSVP